MSAGNANLVRLQEATKGKFDGLSIKAKDWAWWDDTAAFILGTQPGYDEANMSKDYFTNLGLSFAVFTDLENKLTAGKRFDPVLKDFIPDPESLEILRGFMQRSSVAQDCREDLGRGFVETPAGILFAVVGPVCKNNGIEHPVGKILFARILDADTVATFSRSVGAKVTFYSPRQLAADSVMGPILGKFPADKESLVEFPTEQEGIGTLKIKTNESETAGFFRIQMSRDIHALAEKTLESMTFGIAIIIGIIGLCIILLLDRIVLKKLASMSHWISGVDHSQLNHERMIIGEKDEIGSLGGAINQMLDVIGLHTKLTDEHNSALTNLVRVLSHDLANSLTIIESSAKFGAQDYPENKDFLRILRGSESLRKIISHVRDMDAQQSGKMQLKLAPTLLDVVIDHLKFTFADKMVAKNLTLSIEIGKDLSVKADETVLTNTVLGNLMSNAIKFTPAGKCITVNARKVEGNIKISVIDQGIGLPKELQEVVFSPTAPTTRLGTQGEKGTGFGMPLVRSAVERMGGTVEIDSCTAADSPGRDSGTTVTVTLKAA